MKIGYLASAQSIHTKRWAIHFKNCGYEVIVISFQPGDIQGVKVLSLPQLTPWRRMDILLNLRKVRRLVKEIAPDILHAHYATSYGLAGVFAKRRPFIVTAWGSDVLISPEESWLYRQMVRFVLSRADLITSMAEHMTRHLVERGYAPVEKIITLPFGVDTDLFHLNRRTRSHLGGPCLVVSTRRLDRGYDVDTIIKAIPEVIRSYPYVRFIIAGEGNQREEFEQLAVRLRVKDKIEFRGQIPHHEMPGLLGEADVFVTTSPSDGNNISLNEAMACGAFPIATDIPANRAWIEHRRNGLLFPCRDVEQLAEMIIEALRQPEWRLKVMDVNWEIVRTKASWAQSMAEMENHYFRLLRERGIK